MSSLCDFWVVIAFLPYAGNLEPNGSPKGAKNADKTNHDVLE
jgi:hypothetical protein